MSHSIKSVLISGASGTGKSASLESIRGHEGVLYLNCEGGKPLPFRNKFKQKTIDDPYEIHHYLDAVNQDTTGKFHTIVIDTVSFLMDRFVSYHIVGASNTMAKWGEYGEYFRDLMMEYVAKSDIPVIFLGHLDTWQDETSGEVHHTVPVKGALKKNGIEAFFTTVINVKKMQIKSLTDNKLLNISDRDREVGYKHVFQTRTTKHTIGDRIRSPKGLFSDDELYIDNDVQQVIDRLDKYYNE